jgi:riboflavin biosynthesis pyrimidine reductase
VNLPLCGDILLEMTVIASLVVGSNGATSLDGRSHGLSTAPDRARFLRRHRSAAAFIIGKKSAAVESYATSSVPIFIFSRSTKRLELPHPLMQQVTVDRNLADITQLIDLRIEGEIVVEAGASLLSALIDVGVIEILELSISPIAGDSDFINLGELLSKFQIISELEVDGTRLLECRYKRDTANS